MSRKKTPVVLLPGLLCDADLWRDQVAGLSDIAECQVADLTRHEFVAGMAEDVLEAAPERFALAALSMGGYVAHEIMRRAPERVERLAILDSSARPDSDEQRSRRRGLIELAEKGKFKGVTPRLLPMLLHPDRLNDEALTGRVMAMAERIGKAAFLRQQKAILGRPDSRPGLSRYELPVLILAGKQDVLTPPEASAEMARVIPGADCVILDDCAHLSTMEKPRETTRCLRDWLTG